MRYEATADPSALTVCHCRSCRLASGGPSLAWAVFPGDAFRFTSGTPVRFASSPGITRSFCGSCGTSLTWQQDTRSGTIDITSATLDDAAAFAPTKVIWVEHKLPWEALNPSIAHYARSSVGASPIVGPR